MIEFKGKIDENGKIVVPPEYQPALEAHVGDEVTIRMVDEGTRKLTTAEAIKRAQELLRRYIPEGRSLSDELIAERRLEAQNE